VKDSHSNASVLEMSCSYNEVATNKIHDKVDNIPWWRLYSYMGKCINKIINLIFIYLFSNQFIKIDT